MSWDDPVCRVNGAEILRRDVEAEKNKALPWSSFHRNVDAAKQQVLRRRALQALIDTELQYQDARKRKLKVSRGELAGEYQRLVERYPNEEAFEDKLEESGVSVKQVKTALKRKLLVARAEEQVAGTSDVSDDEARTYYLENRATFELPRRAEVREILVYMPPLERSPAEWQQGFEEAEALRGRLEGGESFETLIKEASQVTDATRVQVGQVGIVHPGQLEAPLDEALWSLEEGQVSHPIRGFKGFYLIKVDRFIAPQQMQFEEIQDGIKRIVQRNRASERIQEWRQGLRDDAEIEILDSYLRPQQVDGAGPDSADGESAI